ncbi:diguanylate cyclase (GGDEF)-like protein/PAS domain S-box-containing protein [Arthrobacter sp. CAN_A6]
MSEGPEVKLLEADRRAQRLIDTAADGFVGMDAFGVVTDWNRAAEELFGYTKDEAIGRTVSELIMREQDRAAHEVGLRRFVATGQARLVGRPVQVTARHRLGREFPIDLTIWAQDDPDGVSLYAFLRDVSERAAAAELSAQLAAIVTASSDAIFSTELDGTVRTWNPGAERIYGYAAGDMIGRSFVRLVPTDLSAEFEYILAEVSAGRQIEQLETVRLRADGVTVEMSLTVSPVRDEAGTVLRLAYVGRDITAAKTADRRLRETKDALARQASEMEHRAFHDPLTGIANRALLMDRLGLALTKAERTGTTIILLMIDIDDFKYVNDTLGHSAGDQLLCEIAARLKGIVRAGDTVARLGGDEFAVLAEQVSPDHGEGLAQRIIGTLADPIDIGGQRIIPRASIGLAETGRFPLGEAEDLLRNADLAMYAAKTAGKAQWRAFQPEMHHNAHSSGATGGGPACRTGNRPVHSGVPAHLRPGYRPDSCGRGTPALATPYPRHSFSNRIHPYCRTDWADRSHRCLGTHPGMPPDRPHAHPIGRSRRHRQRVHPTTRRTRIHRHRQARP